MAPTGWEVDDETAEEAMRSLEQSATGYWSTLLGNPHVAKAGSQSTPQVVRTRIGQADAASQPPHGGRCRMRPNGAVGCRGGK